VPDTNHCSKCGVEQPATSEYFRPKHNVCRNCDREAARIYRHEHRDQILSRFREYRAKDGEAEKRRTYRKQRRARNRDREINRAKEWRKNNPDKVKAYEKQYRPTGMINLLCGRARKLGFAANFTLEDWQICTAYWQLTCAYCEKAAAKEADHFISLKCPDCPGTVPTNILPTCKACNVSKSDDSADAWLTKKFGAEYAIRKLSQIHDYFDSVEEQQSSCREEVTNKS
jgi:5-methylcytosine-specific restriction endonuclease McrA